MEMGSFTHDPPGQEQLFFWGAAQPGLDVALALAGEDISRVIAGQADWIRAVQIADMPGRVEPGAGGLAFGPMLAALDAIGWPGMIETEFDPRCGEPEMLAALAAFSPGAGEDGRSGRPAQR
jgi:hypothetical protein